MIETKPRGSNQPRFHQGELITWHDFQGEKCIPVPGVVVRQETESVLIRTFIQGKQQMIAVNPNQLAHR